MVPAARHSSKMQYLRFVKLLFNTIYSAQSYKFSVTQMLINLYVYIKFIRIFANIMCNFVHLWLRIKPGCLIFELSKIKNFSNDN